MMQYNEPSSIKVIPTLKRTLTMDIDKYIDVCLLDEYAMGNVHEGFYLDVDSIPEHDRANFLDMLMQDDTSVRDFVLHAMQKMIDARLEDFELSKRADAGLRLVRLPDGDSRLERAVGASW